MSQPTTLASEAEALARKLLRCYEHSVTRHAPCAKRQQTKRLAYAATERYFRRIEAQKGDER